MTTSDLQPHANVLAVQDLAGSAAYFVDSLGFSIDLTDGENWHALIRGEVRLMLGRCPHAPPASKLGEHSYFGFLTAGHADGLHAEFEARAALILSAAADKPWVDGR